MKEKIEYNDRVTKNISTHYLDILEQIGENPNREGLQKTPERVAKALQFLTQGYDLNPDEII